MTRLTQLMPALYAALMLVAGCTTTPPTVYYTLAAEPVSRAKPPGEFKGYRVAIGPATVPAALDRSQIVLRLSMNQYAISDTQLWSAPLKREIPRVIADEMALLLPAAHVTHVAQSGAQNADYRVPIDVIHFESGVGQSIRLVAEWRVQNRAGESLREARSEWTEPVAGTGVSPLINAHRKALAALAREIATTLEALPQK